ncbi:Rab family GTPase [Chondrinema litorale]|uniref:Rab family GTPase n=1 Tax=Chondrinema litorale TaxID=2994555 RepID=UPI002542C618|nr:Rab family GTPase [Chondrinema litorale]UZR95424.1 GTP-binding protein [Chondrinema litorale]
MASKKIILLGKYGVGKTSLIRQFVYNKFSDQYLTTIGVKIDKKVVSLDNKEVNLLIWDIAGESDQKKVPASYKLGSHAAIYVFDLTRPATYENLNMEIAMLKQQVPNIPIILVGNKKDLIPASQLESICEQIDIKVDLLTSAKTSENVETLFFKVAEFLI